MANVVVVHLIVVLVMLSCSPVVSFYNGEGTYVGSDNVHRNDGYKCWSDYFVVDQGIRPGNWKKASGDVYCTGTSVCQISHVDGYSECETWSTEFSTEAKAEILSFSMKSGYSFQTCMTANNALSCSWKDQQCHCIWARANFAYQDGYHRDRCDRGKGDRTENMVPFHHEAPSGPFTYGCGSKCTDTAADLNFLATV